MAAPLPARAGALPHGQSLTAPAAATRFVLHNGTREPPLGIGGFATVYSATYYNRPAAAKVVRAAVGTAASAAHDDADGLGFARECLDNELRFLPCLRHPGILTYLAYQYLAEEGSHIMFVEEMAGGSLADVISLVGYWRLPLSAASFLDAALQLTAALTYMHDHGIVHGDVKPANIFLSGPAQVDDATSAVVLPPGVTVKLGDLGVAVNEADGRPTRGFTPGFISPECCGPAAIAAAGRAQDMYALGVVLFLLLVPGELAHRLLGSRRSSQPLTAADVVGLAPVWPPAEEVDSGGLFGLVTSLPGVVRLVKALLAANPADRPTAWQVHAALLDSYHVLGADRFLSASSRVRERGSGGGRGTPVPAALPMNGRGPPPPRRRAWGAAADGAGRGAGGAAAPAAAVPPGLHAELSDSPWPYGGAALGDGVWWLSDGAPGPAPRMPPNLRAAMSPPPREAAPALAVGRVPASLPVAHDADEADPLGGVTGTAESLDLLTSVQAAVLPAHAWRLDAAPRPAVREADDGGDPLGGASGIGESLDMLSGASSRTLEGVTGITESLDLLTSLLSHTTPDASHS